MIIAIDPGASGGIAANDEAVAAFPMPEGMTDQADLLRALVVSSRGKSVVVYIEKTGTYQPGNSGPAAATFARHCGHLEAIVYMLGVPLVEVSPQKWQKAIGTFPKEKKDRKNAIKEAMARLYPHLKVTLKTSDALAILTYAEKQFWPNNP